MHGMKVPHFNECKDKDSKWVFYEPKPRGQLDDSTLEGCLRYAAKVEQMMDKQNLYLCEQCTEDKFGKSNLNLLTPYLPLIYRVKEKA